MTRTKLKNKIVAVLILALLFSAYLPTVPYAYATFSNVALNKPVGVSANMDTDPTGDTTVDGDVGGGQDAFDGFGRTTDNLFVGDAFYIDLGLPYTINETRMLWVTHTLSDVKYHISYSSDNATWIIAVDHNATQRVGGSATWENKSFTDITARYWKWEKVHDSKGYATNDPIRELELWGEAVDIDMSVTITNMDFSNYLFAGEKFYLFVASAQSTNSSIDQFSMRFNDTNTVIQVTYDNATDTLTVDSGDDVATIGSPTVTSVLSGQIYNLTVVIPIWLKTTIFDAQNVDIDMMGNTTGGKTQSWFAARENYFNIYNHGGLAVMNTTGSAGRIAGGDTFELQASNLTSAEVNQTWAKLQHYHTQFSIRFTENGVGEDQYMQDATHDGGVDKSSDKGDWLLEIGVFYFDDDVNVWVKGWHVLLQMEEGDQGVNDMWIKINASWYRNDVFVKSDTFTAWLELEPAAKFRLWLDLWFNQANNSQLHGGRVTAYYYGMDGTWGNWAPLNEEQSQSSYFNNNLNNASQIISAQELGLMKVYYNLTRPSTQAGEANFTTSLREFDLTEFVLASGVMRGVATPIEVEVKIPDVTQTGFFAPLYAAINSIAGSIIGSLMYIADIGWRALQQQFPWFTDFWENTVSLVIRFVDFAIVIGGHLVNLLDFLWGLIVFITYPIQIVYNMWVYISAAYNTLFGAADITGIAQVFVIIIFSFSILDAINRGDMSYLIRMTKQVWSIAETFLNWAFRLVKFITDIIFGAVPF